MINETYCLEIYKCVCVCVVNCSVVFDSLQLHGPQSMGFFRLECWSGLPFPPPGDLPRPGIKPHLLHWQTDALPVSHLGLKKGENVCIPSSAVSQNIWKANASWRL